MHMKDALKTRQCPQWTSEDWLFIEVGEETAKATERTLAIGASKDRKAVLRRLLSWREQI